MSMIQATYEHEDEASRPGIEARIAALAAQVPDEEWRRLPHDLSDHLDHYVYGLPEQGLQVFAGE